MKKTLIALALATAGMAAIPAFAQNASSNKDGWFIGANIGEAKLSKGAYNGNDTGYAINGGYRWAVSPSVALGLEAGYNDLGSTNPKNVFNSAGIANPRSDLHGWTLGVNGHFNITPNWYASARAGLYQWKGRGVSSGENPVSSSLDKTDWYGGVGFGYDFSNNFSLGLNYDYYQAKKDPLDLRTRMLSLGAEYRF